MKKLFYFFALFLYGLVLSSPVQAQQSSCQFTIKSMEAQPAAVTSNSIITFYATVEQTGSGPACSSFNRPTLIFYAKTRCLQYATYTPVCTQDVMEMTRTTSLSFQSASSQTVSVKYDLANFNFSNLENPNSLPYYMSVVIGGTVYADNKAWNKALAVSGATGGSGSSNVYNVTVSFDKSEATPTGGDLTVFANMSTSDINRLPFSVAMLTYVCDQNGGNCKQVGNNYGSSGDGFNRRNLQNDQTFQTVPVSLQNGFKDGPNRIRVDIQDSLAPYRLYARGTGTIFANGLGQGQQPGAGGGAGAGAGTGAEAGSGAGSGAGKVDTSLTEKLFNPLPLDSLTGVLLYIARGFLAIVALWAVTFIIIGGFKMVMAQGNEEAYLAAKKTITWAVLGLVIAMFSFSIVAIVQNLIGATVRPP